MARFRDEKRGPFAVTRQAGFAPGEIGVSLDDLVRYAGGSGYKPAANMVPLLEEARNRALALARPKAAWRLCHLGESGEGTAGEGDGILEVFSQSSPGAVLLGAVVITLGPALEEESGRLLDTGQTLEALYLDAAGSALLKSLDRKVTQILEQEARELELAPCCRLTPGLNNIPLTRQGDMFRLVDAAALGVALNEGQMMIPAKSVSFFLLFAPAAEGRSPVAGERPWSREAQCAGCDLKNCLYRKRDQASTSLPR